MVSFSFKLSLKSQSDADLLIASGRVSPLGNIVIEDSLEYFFVLVPEPGKTGYVTSIWDIASSGLTL